MLQVAVARLATLWPAARIDVLTDSPPDLARYCPRASPLPRGGCKCWTEAQVLLGKYHQLLPNWVSVRLSTLKRQLGAHWPSLLALLLELRLRVRDGSGRLSELRAFLAALKNTDLMVVCGAGGFADSCRQWNLSILGTIESAIRRGIPVAMFGQSMGPLSDALTLSLAKKVLPKVNVITLRGTSGGLDLLKSIGVPPQLISTTGDEAVELAYANRPDTPGKAIGINLRVASYAEVKENVIEKLRVMLQDFARKHDAGLVPIPIAFHECANDNQTIRQLLEGFDDGSDGGLFLDTPDKLVRQTARCRIVVTGAYHAAVFALGQGIPAVCLTNSSYYLAKFEGLKDLFGAGCAIVSLSAPGWPDTLLTAMEAAWTSAEGVRATLLNSATRQIEDGQRAYRRLHSSVTSESGNAQLVFSRAT